MMVHLDIPGREPCALEHLVLDLSGTLALDGEVLPGVAGRLAALSPVVTVHLLTADTGGNAAEICERLNISWTGSSSGTRQARNRHSLSAWALRTSSPLATAPTMPECWLRLP